MKLFSLNRPARSNQYCGPAVLSFLTGQDTSECASWFRRFGNHRGAVRGSYERDMRLVLTKLGIDYVPLCVHPRGKGPTLARWLRENKERRTPGRVYLIIAGHHWQLVTGRRYACGRVGTIVSIKDKEVKRRARVAYVWELVIRDKLTIPEPQYKKPTYNKERAKAYRLLKKYGEAHDLTCEDDRFERWSRYVGCPDWIHKDLTDFHYAHDWQEALGLLQMYIAEIGTANDMRTHPDPEKSLLTQVRY